MLFRYIEFRISHNIILILCNKNINLSKLKLVVNLKGQANVIRRNHLKGNLHNSLAEVLLLGDKVIQERTGYELLSQYKRFKIRG